MGITAQLPGIPGAREHLRVSRTSVWHAWRGSWAVGSAEHGGISAHGKRSVRGQAPLRPVLCHRIPSLAHSKTPRGWDALDQEQGHTPGPTPPGSEIRGWGLKAAGVPSSSQLDLPGSPGLPSPGCGQRWLYLPGTVFLLRPSTPRGLPAAPFLLPSSSGFAGQFQRRPLGPEGGLELVLSRSSEQRL
uniref:Uncharacterized protein n=1 Tax=Molossus molossus TaxID=27622 RepID=A0A7J8EEM1_MOLMO|nr:hypothetical protein HJG59_008807 [Molossus molossus]